MAGLDFSVFSGTGSGVTQGMFAKVMAVFAVIIIVILGIGFLIYFLISLKKYYITIELYKRVDNQNRLVRKYKACEHRVGKAGDILWYVAKANKYIPPGNIQSGANIYKYFQRSDGEWINFQIGDIDEQMRMAGVKYIDNDMRSQRISISKTLDNELKEQGFWSKYGTTITYILEILIFGVACVIIFYQFSEVVTKMDQVVARVDSMMVNAHRLFGNASQSSIYKIPL
jgi:hypothetical protein